MTKTKPYPVYKDSGVEWLEAIPTHWTLSRFGLEMSINTGQVDPSEERWAETWLVAPNHIESGTGRILGKETASAQGADSGKYVARKGQILYSKIRPALNKVAIAEEDCLCSADMYAMSSIRRDDHRYLAYYMLAAPFHAFASEMSGRVKMPKINREELSAAPWLLPPLDEQRQIVAFLNRETAKIDELIGKQVRLIETLRERRAAVITHMITRGLDPSVRLKPTSTDWLPWIPESWTVHRLGHVIDSLPGFAFSSEGFTADSDDIRLLRGANLNDSGVGRG